METQNYIANLNKKPPFYNIHNFVPLYVVNEPTSEIDFNRIKRRLELIPSHLFYNIDIIYVGSFKHLTDRDVKAVYDDGAIYVTNRQKDEEDLYDDILHEIGHAVEKTYYEDIFLDNQLEYEYLSKKDHVIKKLNSYGENISTVYSYQTKYNKEFDEYLFYDLGFSKLENFTRGILVTPYSMTSISEYFCEGLEYFIKSDPNHLQKVCPVLYNKVKTLIELD